MTPRALTGQRHAAGQQLDGLVQAVVAAAGR